MVETWNGTCQDNGLDWYTNLVGETPCQTYERLNQICMPSYHVDLLHTQLPPDVCIFERRDCCCNSIAFSLSMLCTTCQHGAGSSGIGFDAPPGTYQRYLDKCSPQFSRSLPTFIQNAACDSRLQLLDAFYNRVFWDDGAWFFAWSRDFISSKDPAPFECTIKPTTTSFADTSPYPTLSSPYSTTSPSSVSLSSQATSSTQKQSLALRGGQIAGIIVGITALLVTGILAGWIIYRRRVLNRPSVPPPDATQYRTVPPEMRTVFSKPRERERERQYSDAGRALIDKRSQ